MSNRLAWMVILTILIVAITGCSSVLMNENNGESIEVTNRGLDNISVTVHSVDEDDTVTILYTNGTDRDITAMNLGTINNYYGEIDGIRIHSRNSTMAVSANSTAKMNVPDQEQGEDIVVIISKADGTLIQAHGISCQLSPSGDPEITYTIESGSVSTRGKNCAEGS